MKNTQLKPHPNPPRKNRGFWTYIWVSNNSYISCHTITRINIITNFVARKSAKFAIYISTSMSPDLRSCYGKLRSPPPRPSRSNYPSIKVIIAAPDKCYASSNSQVRTLSILLNPTPQLPVCVLLVGMFTVCDLLVCSRSYLFGCLVDRLFGI